jgi:hypothetical protein
VSLSTVVQHQHAEAVLAYEVARAQREVAIADFFKECTGLLKLCAPLVKQTVAEAAAKQKASRRTFS